jgi:hypothetical protein
VSDLLIRSVKKIWDYAKHNALTDLILYKSLWYCVFRESDDHVFGKDGVIRILVSDDGELWTSAALIEKKGIDLRDPKLSVTGKGQLMLLLEEVRYQDKKALSRRPSVSFSFDGRGWTPLQHICKPFDWLWRVTWYEGRAWGVSYRPGHDKWRVWLYTSQEGLQWDKVVEWKIPGSPNETTLQFTSDKTMVALVRRNFKQDGCAWIGTAAPPYQDWKWTPTKHHLGGPHFLILPNQTMWACGRIVERNPYGWFEKTALLSMTLDKIQPVLLLPSGGIDCSYPGMVFHNRELWVSYYSSHEGRTSIYLARVQLPSD